jgi:hypothetical protein
MEIAFLLQKRVTEAGRRIEFSSEWGMPVKGGFQWAGLWGRSYCIAHRGCVGCVRMCTIAE